MLYGADGENENRPFDRNKPRRSFARVDPNAIFLGAFAPLNEAQLENSEAVYAYRLALRDFNSYGATSQYSGGLPDGPNGARRPLVFTICFDDREVENSVRFLTEELRVPAILAGFRDPQNLLRSFQAAPAGKVFLLSPFGGNLDLKQLKDNSLVWSLLGSPSDFAGAYRALLTRLEKKLRSSGVLENDAPLRVASFQTQDNFSSELALFAEGGMQFNGVDLGTNLNAGNYLPLFFNTEQGTLEELAAKSDQIVDFKPHVVISFAGRPFTAPDMSVLSRVQARWAVDAPRPHFILSPLNEGVTEPDQVGNLIRTELRIKPGSEPQRRFLGIGSALYGEKAILDAFKTDMIRFFSDGDHSGSGQFYDAMYFLGYAIYGAGSVGMPNASEIAFGMKRLVSPQAFPNSVGSTQMPYVFGALAQNGAEISLQGTLGPPRFETGTGMRIDPGSLYCFDSDFRVHRNALPYDLQAGDFPRTDQFPEDLPCTFDF